MRTKHLWQFRDDGLCGQRACCLGFRVSRINGKIVKSKTSIMVIPNHEPTRRLGVLQSLDDRDTQRVKREGQDCRVRTWTI